ncbi:MAG TPA: SDR family NAD(P)-dependent oxidoreductase [Candidatus Saccharimonadia bacterium]|nr:SDR family NAD(P)-dependent oxidoreductase [Candidatus Saccharimonadia bacterium]
MRELVAMPPGYVPAANALAGRVVLVTGASGGLGAAASRAAARAGATVVLLGRRVRALEKLYDELKLLGQEPAIYPLDLEGATAADYDELAATIARECGGLDAILHAAAHFEGLTPLALVEPAAWLRALHVNLGAATALTQACVPLLQKSADASVVFVLDDGARIERAYWGGYAVAKAGLESLIRVWADELEKSTVRIAGLLPGPMRTALRARAYFAEDPGTIDEPAVYAPACTYLLGPDGASVRGAVLDARPLGSA